MFQQQSRESRSCPYIQGLLLSTYYVPFSTVPKQQRQRKGSDPIFLQAGWDVRCAILHSCAQRTCIMFKKEKEKEKKKKKKKEKGKKKGKKIKKKKKIPLLYRDIFL